MSKAAATNITSRRALTAYLDATARHAEATRLMVRAQRTFNKLCIRGVDEDRAYKLAGVGLADVRDVRACTEEREAFARLKAVLVFGPPDLVALIRIAGAVFCAHIPRAANRA